MRRRATILIVDDEPRIVRFLRTALEDEGFRTLAASTGAAALDLLEQERPSAVVLDLILPDVDGLDVLRQIRAASPVPVILLSARSADADKVRGLNAGADDYVTKPFNLAELIARLHAVLRRAGPEQLADATPLVLDDLRIDLARRQVQLAGHEITLSPTEWRLLSTLAQNAGRVVLHEELLTRTWGPAFRDDLQYLRVWISRLRRKLGDSRTTPRYIRTVNGVGYCLRA